jgi:hypothetical protein
MLYEHIHEKYVTDMKFCSHQKHCITVKHLPFVLEHFPRETVLGCHSVRILTGHAFFDLKSGCVLIICT